MEGSWACTSATLTVGPNLIAGEPLSSAPSKSSEMWFRKIFMLITAWIDVEGDKLPSSSYPEVSSRTQDDEQFQTLHSDMGCSPIDEVCT